MIKDIIIHDKERGKDMEDPVVTAAQLAFSSGCKIHLMFPKPRSAKSEIKGIGER
jgi:hypothetical protein